MEIRPGTRNDLPALMALLRRVVPQMLAAGNLQWDENYPNELAFERDIEKSQLWVVEIDDVIAGVAAITTDPEPEYVQADIDIEEPAVIVHRLAVDPSFRGVGVARALMQQAEHSAIASGIAAVRVDTNTQNAETQSLFPKLGYRLAGEIGLQIRPNLRFLCYEKRLLVE